MDVATDFSVPLAMKVIAGMIGIPLADWSRYKRWSDSILTLSYTRSGGERAEASLRDFMAVTGEMSAYLSEMTEQRRAKPQDDLLTRLLESEVDGQRLSHEEILGFFQLLVVAGQETTSDLINNALISFLENPGQLGRLRANLDLLPSAIEEVLRYRSPLQWMMRKTPPREALHVHGPASLPIRFEAPIESHYRTLSESGITLKTNCLLKSIRRPYISFLEP